MGCVFRDLTGQLSMQGRVRQSNLKSQSPEELQLGRLTRENQITGTSGYRVYLSVHYQRLEATETGACGACKECAVQYCSCIYWVEMVQWVMAHEWA
jgi:hypothetical protein